MRWLWIALFAVLGFNAEGGIWVCWWCTLGLLVWFFVYWGLEVCNILYIVFSFGFGFDWFGVVTCSHSRY